MQHLQHDDVHLQYNDDDYQHHSPLTLDLLTHLCLLLCSLFVTSRLLHRIASIQQQEGDTAHIHMMMLS